MSIFKNQAEIYRALLEGKKLTNKDWDKGTYIYLKSGILVDDKGNFAKLNFQYPKDYEIYKEKIQTVVRYLWVSKTGQVTSDLYSEEEIGSFRKDFPVKLE